MTQLELSLAQAQQIYRANGRAQGLGIQIAHSQFPGDHQPAASNLAGTRDFQESRWTASNDHHSPSVSADRHGAAKPAGWNADLIDQGNWLLPVDGEVQQAGFEWNASDRHP